MTKTKLSYCAEQVQSYDPDRFLSALFAAEQDRKDLFALFAFNIEIAKIREIVTEPILGEIRLQWWRDTIAQLYDRQPIEHPIGRALAEAIKRKSLARERFDAMIDGRMRDIHDQTPETFADLLDYLSNTSAQLFRLAASALGNDDPSLDEAAKHAGLAWALVGIIRAVPFHAGQGRLYLPLDLLRDAGITPDEAVHGGGVPGLAAVVERLAQEAGTHIAAARRLAPRVSPRILPAFLPVRLARGYLKAIARSRFDPFALGPPPRPMRRLLSLAAGQLMRRF